MATENHPLAKYGRADDRLIGHLAHGEMIIPAPVVKGNPQLVHAISQAIRDAGADPEQYKVGNEKMSINPVTGQPEFGFFSSIFSIFKTILPILATAVTGNPMIGAALGAGLGATKGGGIPGALMGAAGGYFGGAGLNGAISGFSGLPAGGVIGPTAGGLSGAISGAQAGVSQATNAISNALGIGSGTVGMAGKALGALSAVNSFSPSGGNAASSNPASLTARPKGPGARPKAMERPNSLMDYSGYDAQQERSALATKGLNTGLGEDENSYYRNLIQRALIGEGNRVDNKNSNFLLPIEQTYWNRQGVNTGDARSFLGGIR